MGSVDHTGQQSPNATASRLSEQATTRMLHRITPVVAEPVVAPRRSYTLSPGAVALIYLAAIAVAEVITALINPELGVLMHIGILGSLVLHAGLTEDEATRTFLLSLAIAPLIRVVSLGMPLGHFRQEWWYALSSAPLFAASYVLIRSVSLSRRQVALRLPSWRAVPMTLLVVASGFWLGVIEFWILRPQPLTDSLAPSDVVLPALILLIGTGLVEELIFRGILQTTVSPVLPGWRGILYVSVLFAVLHTGHLSFLDVVFVLGVALYFAVMVRSTKSLLGVSLAHGLTNIMLFIVIPLLHR